MFSISNAIQYKSEFRRQFACFEPPKDEEFGIASLRPKKYARSKFVPSNISRIAQNNEMNSENGVGSASADIDRVRLEIASSITRVPGVKITHSSLGNGSWSILHAVDNNNFLQAYANAVAPDWLCRFQPIMTSFLRESLVSSRMRSQALLNPDIESIDDELAIIARTKNPSPPKSTQNWLSGSNYLSISAELSSHSDDPNNQRSFSTVSSPSSYHASLDAEDVGGDYCSIDDSKSLPPFSSMAPPKGSPLSVSKAGKLGFIPKPTKPNSHLSISEIGSPECFKLFFDVDTKWVCDKLSDEDTALISLMVKIIQQTVRLFYPNANSELWRSLGTVACTRTEPRIVVKKRSEFSGAWDKTLAKLDQDRDYDSCTFGSKKRHASSPGGIARSNGNMDDASSVASHANSIWSHSSASKSSSTSSTFSSSSSSSSNSTSVHRPFEDVGNMLIDENTNDAFPEMEMVESGNATTSMMPGIRSHATIQPSTSVRPSINISAAVGAKTKKKLPKHAAEAKDILADSTRVYKLIQEQLKVDGVYTVYKVGMHVHFPSLLVNIHQARLIREHIVCQLVLNIANRPDLLKTCALLAFGDQPISIASKTLSSTLRHWNSIVDDRVYKDNGPNARMIFSRRINDCLHCIDFGVSDTSAAASTGKGLKRKSPDDDYVVSKLDTCTISVPKKKTYLPLSTKCAVCDGTGMADEGPSAVGFGLFAINGDGNVCSQMIESCLDSSSDVVSTSVFKAVNAQPIIISPMPKAHLSSRTGISDDTSYPSEISFKVDSVLTPCVRFLPPLSKKVERLTSTWVKLTSIRHVSSNTHADGTIPKSELTAGFQIPPCWCHFFDDHSVGADDDGSLTEHIKTGGAPLVSTTASGSTLLRNSISALQNGGDRQSDSPNSINPLHSRCNKMHNELSKFVSPDAMRQRALSALQNKIDNTSSVSFDPSKKTVTRIPSTSVSKDILAHHDISYALVEFIRSKQPILWEQLWFNPVQYLEKTWKLPDNGFIKSKVAAHQVVLYDEKEREAIRHVGKVFIVTCAGSQRHNCLIKGDCHKSSTIYWRVTPTHIFQLCSSKSTSMCNFRFHILCPLSPYLSQVLFS